MLIHVEGSESLAAAEETVSCSFPNQFDGPLYKWVCSRIILWQSALRVYEKSRLWCVVRVCVCVEATPSSLTARWGCGAVKPAGMHPEAAAYHQQAQTGLELNGNTSEHIQCYLGK